MRKRHSPYLSKDGVRPLRLVDSLDPPRRKILNAEWELVQTKESKAEAELFYWIIIAACVGWIILMGALAVLTRIQLYGSVF